MRDVMEPTNVPGDQEGCQFNPDDASVTTPTGFKEAYRQFSEGGWTSPRPTRMRTPVRRRMTSSMVRTA